MFDAFTDYPITELGDIENKRAPIRKCKILTYDRNKYADVMIFFQDADGDERAVITNFKSFYIYKNEGRFNEGTWAIGKSKTRPVYIERGEPFTYDELITLPWKY